MVLTSVARRSVKRCRQSFRPRGRQPGLLKISKDKRALKFCKKRLGTHIHGKKKREEMQAVIQARRKAAGIAENLQGKKSPEILPKRGLVLTSVARGSVKICRQSFRPRGRQPYTSRNYPFSSCTNDFEKRKKKSKRRAMELLKISKDKRTLKFCKNRLGAHIRGKKKREGMQAVIQAQRKAAGVAENLQG